MIKLRFWPSFTRSYRMLLAFSGFVLLLGVALGYGTWAVDPISAKAVVEEVIAKHFTPLIAQMAETGWWGQFLVIAFNNIRATALIMISGAILPIIPFIVGLMPNGMFIGLLAGLFEYERNLPKSSFFLSLLPHGIFEIPAILLAATVGVIWGVRNWRSLLRGGGIGSLGTHAKESMAFIPLLFALLVIAALMEVLVTPLLFTLPRLS